MLSRLIKKMLGTLMRLLSILAQDQKLRFQIYLILGLGIVARLFIRGLSDLEYILLGFGVVLVVLTELQYAALALALRRLDENLQYKLRQSMGISALTVLIAGGVLVIAFGLVLFNQFA